MKWDAGDGGAGPGNLVYDVSSCVHHAPSKNVWVIMIGTEELTT
jgi:hypothetical protein